MAVSKLESTDGFVVYDYPDAPSSGVVRRGRKILQRSATDLARSATYAFAFHSIERGGASAGLNAEGDATAPALEAMLAELAEPLSSGNLEMLAGKGVSATELNGTNSDSSDALLAAGVIEATTWALDTSLSDATFAIEGFSADNPTTVEIVRAFEEAGATQVQPAAAAKPWEIWGLGVDVLLTGSKPGVMNHQGAEMVSAKAVVPWGPIPITTKALAVLLRSEVTYVPDFVSAAGPVVARHLPGTSGAQDAQSFSDAVTRTLDRSNMDSDESLFVVCCQAAESFLDSWRDKRPFGRPLAG